MKPCLAALALFLISAIGLAGEITITGPIEADIGQTIQLRIDGLPKVDMTAPFAETVEWFERDDLVLLFSVPSDSNAVLDESLTMTVRPFRWRYQLEFNADRPGAYVLVANWKYENTDQLLLHRIEAGGIPPDPDPDDPVPPPTDGLHAVIVDDENIRGHLPQSQLNIFTSIELANWLKENTATADDGGPAFRFSSNDSLVRGEPARELELPVFVGGWDAVMDAVRAGQISLPAWAISNGERGVIEALPQSVDAAIRRLEEFK